MESVLLRISQYVHKHPIKEEREEYKNKYINVLEYFIRKYSAEDIYSESVLALYKNKLLSTPENYSYREGELKRISKVVMAWRMKRFKVYSYRYCLLADVLFICAFVNPDKSKNIYEEFLGVCRKRHYKKMSLLYDWFLQKPEMDAQWERMEYIKEAIIENKLFLNQHTKKILVTANMSAGKSTLLNALVGKKINKTKNDSCTAKVHWIYNKSFEDGLICELDRDFEIDASLDVLMTDNEQNELKTICVATYFRRILEDNRSLCFIDTPGVNSSREQGHMLQSREAILKHEFDTLVYVMNAGAIGTEDERKHLEYVYENYKGKIIFVVNKMDIFRTKEDSISATLNGIRDELKSIGYEEPIICPISAYAAYLAKMEKYGEGLNDDERDEKEHLQRRLGKKEYQFNNFYPEAYREILVADDKNELLLLHSGILSLEKLLYEERETL